MQDIRKQFPIFNKPLPNGKKLVYLDSANSSQKPQRVLDRLYDFYSQEYSSVGRSIHQLSSGASKSLDDSRTAVARFLNADSVDEIVFTKSATEDTADVVMSLILAVPRRIVEGDKRTREGNWDGWSPTGMLGHRINGKRLGIVGMGRIGQAVARRAKGFGMSIHYHNRNKLHSEIEDSLEATWWQNLDQMISRMDIISINCPHTDQTHHMIGEKQLNLFQKHSYLVNAARGEIVDEKKLTDLLVSGNIAGAGLDVYENEPEIDKRLRKLNNVVLLPHIGSATIEGRVAMGEKVIINIKTVADGHTPPDLVLESMI